MGNWALEAGENPFNSFPDFSHQSSIALCFAPTETVFNIMRLYTLMSFRSYSVFKAIFWGLILLVSPDVAVFFLWKNGGSGGI